MFRKRGDGFRRVVGVQRAEHEVAGHGGADGDIGGFRVADLAHEQDVDVLAQRGASVLAKVRLMSVSI